MRQQTNLPAMVGFVRKHVAQHFHAYRPRPSPAVSAKFLDAAPTIAECFREHLRAASGAFGQSHTSLLRRAVRAVELGWNLQVRSCKPDPLAADVVHMREDCRNSTGRDFARRAGRFGCRRFSGPGGRVKMFDKNLVHAIIGGKDLDCGSAELSFNLVWTRGHGSYSFTMILLGRRCLWIVRGLFLPEPGTHDAFDLAKEFTRSCERFVTSLLVGKNVRIVLAVVCSYLDTVIIRPSDSRSGDVADLIEQDTGFSCQE